MGILQTKLSRQYVALSAITHLHLEETVSDAYEDGYCHRCNQKRVDCRQGFLDTGGVRCVERRARPRGTGTFNRILDITYTQIRKTEAEKDEQTRKGD